MIFNFGRSVSIRDYQLNDLTDMADIYEDAFAYEWSADEIAAFLTGSNIKALVLDLHKWLGGNQLLGFVIYRIVADEAEDENENEAEAEILTIAVDSRQRRKGYGQKLMEEVIRRLYHDRVKKLFLEVDHQSESAVNLYKKLDFYSVGEREGYYKKVDGKARSALVMRYDIPKLSV